MMNENIKISGKIIVFKKGKDHNNWYKAYETPNLVVNSGLNFLVQLIDPNTTIPDMGWIGVGSDSTPPAVGDVALNAEILRKAFIDTDTIVNVFRAEAQFDPGEATGTWREAAMLNAAGAGVMFNRAPINFTKLADEAVRVRFEITFA